MPLPKFRVCDDLHWLTTIIAYAHHPEVTYGLKLWKEKPVEVGQYKVSLSIWSNYEST